MRVKLEENYKDFYTVTEYEQAKAVIEAEKEDEESVKGWAEYAVHEALKGTKDYLIEVLKAEAHTAKNRRAWNAYGFDDNTGCMDVWIKATAQTCDGFIVVGAYLSDIWQHGAVEYKHEMFIRYYKEVS